MSPYAACAPQGAALFPELPTPSWFESDTAGESNDCDNPFEPTSTTAPFSDAELLRLAQDFVERSKTLIDAVASPAWEDEDDIFGGEVFDEERAEYQRLSAINPTPTSKETVARELMANDGSGTQGSAWPAIYAASRCIPPEALSFLDVRIAGTHAAPGRRVASERIEGADITGVVLRESALEGYADWKKRWQDNAGWPSSGLERPLAPLTISGRLRPH